MAHPPCYGLQRKAKGKWTTQAILLGSEYPTREDAERELWKARKANRGEYRLVLSPSGEPVC